MHSIDSTRPRRVERALAAGLSLVASLGLLSACTSTPPAPTEIAQSPAASTVSYLYSQSASGGTMTPAAGNTFSLVLTGVSPTTVRFTDRPARGAKGVSTERFINGWSDKFGSIPPNAALVLTEADQSQDTVIVTLTNPKYDAAGQTLTYSATAIANEIPTGLVTFKDQADKSIPEKFGAASLFIDSVEATGTPGQGSPSPSGPAAFYVTFSGESAKGVANPINNVAAVNASGQLVSTSVLQNMPPSADNSNQRELRGMAINSEKTLFVVQSHKTSSMVMQFGPPGPDGTRQPLGSGVFTAYSNTNNGLAHPYAVALNLSGGLYASSQDTYVATQYTTSGSPGAVAGYLTSNYPQTTFLFGTLAAGATSGSGLPAPIPSDSGGLEGPRGIAYLPQSGIVYVADNADGSVKSYNASSGNYLGKVLDVKSSGGQPVGLLISGSTLFVSNEGTNEVISIDLSSGQSSTVVTANQGGVSLDHPSGMALGSDGNLYVLSRKGRQINRYTQSGGSPAVFASGLPDEPEQIVAAA